MAYEIRFTDLANQGLAKLAKSEPKAFFRCRSGGSCYFRLRTL